MAANNSPAPRNRPVKLSEVPPTLYAPRGVSRLRDAPPMISRVMVLCAAYPGRLTYSDIGMLIGVGSNAVNAKAIHLDQQFGWLRRVAESTGPREPHKLHPTDKFWEDYIATATAVSGVGEYLRATQAIGTDHRRITEGRDRDPRLERTWLGATATIAVLHTLPEDANRLPTFAAWDLVVRMSVVQEAQERLAQAAL